MLVGEPSRFAIESEISSAYARASLRGIGFFVIHIASMAYGVRSPDATLLACSFDEVGKRLMLRGKHTAPFASDSRAGSIADAVARAVYAADNGARLFGLSTEEVRDLLHANDIIWAPDGDEAFDDGSCVIQFDVGQRVRLMGFRYDAEYRHIPSSLRDIWMIATDFYELLERWHEKFEAEWDAAEKVSAP